MVLIMFSLSLFIYIYIYIYIIHMFPMTCVINVCHIRSKLEELKEGVKALKIPDYEPVGCPSVELRVGRS